MAHSLNKVRYYNREVLADRTFLARPPENNTLAMFQPALDHGSEELAGEPIVQPLGLADGLDGQLLEL